MADKPILFSAPMVRALLAGTKTQTRRVIKDVPPRPEANCHQRSIATHAAPYLDAYCSERHTPENPRGMSERWCWWQVDDRQCLPTFLLKCKPGDRLYVREHWRTGGQHDHLAPRDLSPEWALPIEYLADGTDHRNGRFRQGMHMPRWASRITLTVTDVRVQRLQDISTGDAEAEGALVPPYSSEFAAVHAVPMYQAIWEGINGPGSWDANPWVAAYTFTLQLGNIDAIEVPHG